MRNDIHELRKSGDLRKKAEGDRLMAGRDVEVPFAFKPGQWYALALEIVDDQVRLSVDDRPVGHLQNPGLAYATKRDLRLSAWGKDPSQEAHYDDLRIWSVKPAGKN